MFCHSFDRERVNRWFLILNVSVGNIMLYHKHHPWATGWLGPVQNNLKTQVLGISHDLHQTDMQPHLCVNQKMTLMQDLLLDIMLLFIFCMQCQCAERRELWCWQIRNKLTRYKHVRTNALWGPYCESNTSNKANDSTNCKVYKMKFYDTKPK